MKSPQSLKLFSNTSPPSLHSLPPPPLPPPKKQKNKTEQEKQNNKTTTSPPLASLLNCSPLPLKPTPSSLTESERQTHDCGNKLVRPDPPPPPPTPHTHKQLYFPRVQHGQSSERLKLTPEQLKQFFLHRFHKPNNGQRSMRVCKPFRSF